MFFVFPCFLLGIPLLFDNENKFKTPKNFVEYWARITSEKISFRVSNIKSLLHTIYVFLIPLLFLMPLIGYFQSIMRADYWVLVEQPEMALIINYDDKFIFKKRDLNTKMFLPYIEILQINESTPLQIRFEYSAINPKLNTKQSEE